MPRNHDYVQSMLTMIDEDRLIALDMARKDLHQQTYNGGVYGGARFKAEDAIERAEVYLKWMTGETKDDRKD